MILDKIVEKKRKQIEQERKEMPFTEMMNLAEKTVKERIGIFSYSLCREDSISIIAEVKKASPSKGIIAKNFDPVKKAIEYEKNSADAVSVLTEKNFFLGCDEYLTNIRAKIELPILRKDFIIDEYQIYQSKVIGADALLLIAAVLTEKEIQRFIEVAQSLGLECLVEVHNEKELCMVLNTSAKIVGINNRNLNDFSIDLKTTARIANKIPKDRIIVSESGIKSADDIKLLKDYGADAVLVGESLMRSKDVKGMIKSFKEV